MAWQVPLSFILFRDFMVRFSFYILLLGSFLLPNITMGLRGFLFIYLTTDYSL